MTQPLRGRRTITGRALVLGMLVVLMVVLLASPLHRYFSSRSDVSRAASQLTDDQSALASLQQQEKLWADPGYVEQQARLRLMYAMPGDTVYVVVTPGQRSDIEATREQPPRQAPGSWNQLLWRSVQTAAS